LTNKTKSTHTEIFVENLPPVIKKLYTFENADIISKDPDKWTQPDGKTPAGACAMSYHKNIKVLVLGDPLTAFT
jgi:hypothetical protein